VLAAEDNSVNQLVLKTLLHQLGVDPTSSTTARPRRGLGERPVGRDPDGHPDAGDGRPDRHRQDPRARTGDRPRAHADRGADRQRHGHQVEQYLAAGMDSHVAKPIEAAALFARSAPRWRGLATGQAGGSAQSPGSQGGTLSFSATTRTSSTILRRIAAPGCAGRRPSARCLPRQHEVLRRVALGGGGFLVAQAVVEVGDGRRSAPAISQSLEADTRLAPRSYFCTCWKVMPRLRPDAPG
jgi:CheY-like chemotaxis protein